MRSISCVLFAAALATAPAGRAGDSAQIPADSDSAFQEWWSGKRLTGDWLGARDAFEDFGLTFKGKYYGAFFGVIKGGGDASRGFWDQGIEFSAEQNFGTLLDVDALDGVKGFGIVRWRDPRGNADPNDYVQATALFNPTNWSSGTQWRLLGAGLEIGSADMLPVKDMIVLRGGWIQPQKEFIDQPLSKLFLNNTINSSKGIGGNISFSSSFSTWGGSLEVKPVEEWYVKGGLFMAYPSATSSANHGLAMQGFGPDVSRNGLMAMGETGVTPSIGSAELPGRYAFGGYWWGVDRASYFSENYDGQWGLYWQADQMLFREPFAAAEAGPFAKGPAEGKSFKVPVAMEKPALSDQGLSAFNLVTFAPKYNNPFPFYFQSGLVYKGLLPMRDKDLTLIAIAYGAYSFYQIEADQMEGEVNQSNYTGVIEGGYRVQVNGFSFVQPFAQYIFRPDGTGATPNAGVLGIYVGAEF